jgi:hypothetical protein
MLIPKDDQTTTTQSDKLPSYLQPFPYLRPARPSIGSAELGSDVSGQNPKHLEASRSIFSSQCMQNRHQALADANFYFFKRQICRSRAEGAPRGRQTIGDALHACELRSVTVSLNTNRFGGAERDRTADPLLAKQVLSQLSYSPISSIARAKPRFGNFPRLPSIPNPHSQMQMVGPGRLELPTPRLSSVCSNQLSYGPILVKPVQPKLDRRGSLSS